MKYNSTPLASYTCHHQTQWTPSAKLSYQSSSHTIAQSIPSEILEEIPKHCQHPSSTPIFWSHWNNTTMIEVEQLQEPVSYGPPIRDNVITLYLEQLCSKYNITYFDTNFMSQLQSEDWNHVKKYFSTNHHHNRQRSTNRPKVTGERAILMPTHVHRYKFQTRVFGNL